MVPYAPHILLGSLWYICEQLVKCKWDNNDVMTCGAYLNIWNFPNFEKLILTFQFFVMLGGFLKTRALGTLFFGKSAKNWVFWHQNHLEIHKLSYIYDIFTRSANKKNNPASLTTPPSSHAPRGQHKPFLTLTPILTIIHDTCLCLNMILNDAVRFWMLMMF